MSRLRNLSKYLLIPFAVFLMAQVTPVIVHWTEGGADKGYPYEIDLAAGDFDATNTNNKLSVSSDSSVTKVGSIGDQTSDFVTDVTTNSSWDFDGPIRIPATAASSRPTTFSAGELYQTTDNADHRRFCTANGANDWECYRTQEDDTVKKGQITRTLMTGAATLNTTTWDGVIWINKAFPITITEVCCRNTGTSASIRLRNTSSGAADIITAGTLSCDGTDDGACTTSLSNTTIATGGYIYFDVNATSAAPKIVTTIVFTKD